MKLRSQAVDTVSDQVEAVRGDVVLCEFANGPHFRSDTFPEPARVRVRAKLREP